MGLTTRWSRSPKRVHSQLSGRSGAVQNSASARNSADTITAHQRTGSRPACTSGMKATIAKNAAITTPNERSDGCFAAAVRPAELTLIATLFPPPGLQSYGTAIGASIETTTQSLAQRSGAGFGTARRRAWQMRLQIAKQGREPSVPLGTPCRTNKLT